MALLRLTQKMSKHSRGHWTEALSSGLHHDSMKTELCIRHRNGCLSDINNQAEAMFIRQIKEMAEKQGVTEALKAENQMEWAGRINNICNQATEFVNAELIYN